MVKDATFAAKKTFPSIWSFFSKFSQLLKAAFEDSAFWNLSTRELDQISDHLLPNYGNSEAI